MRTRIEEEILELKKRRNAIILAHYYETGDIQDLADAVGDSLFLAQEGQRSDADIILLAGVVFMGESVKLLSPQKTVLVPDLHASCSLVHGSPIDKFKAWREKYPKSVCVTYINSSAEVKALSDVIVTSSNAEKIVNSIPKEKQILFAPDANLGRYLSKKLGRDMVLWPGSCEVHVLFSARKLHVLRTEHPDARVLAHPECDEMILAQADVVGATSKLLDEVKKSVGKKFIIATEEGIFHKMRQARPDATLLQAPAEGTCACNQCPYMKLNTLEKVRDALRDLTPLVGVRPEIRDRARLPLERMMSITQGHHVTF